LKAGVEVIFLDKFFIKKRYLGRPVDKCFAGTEVGLEALLSFDLKLRKRGGDVFGESNDWGGPERGRRNTREKRLDGTDFRLLNCLLEKLFC